jgi:MFS family permease
MSAYPAWTPASRPGIVPLHPLGFGTILGRSFAALRHNPRVLLGFALAVQGAAYLISVALVGGVSFAMFSRLNNVPPGSSAYDQILAGSVGITVLVAVVVSLLVGAFGVLVQGVVVVDVARGVLAERPTLREIWTQVRPAAWRLIGYAALLMLAVTLGIALAAGLGIGVGAALGASTTGWAVGVFLTVVAVAASLPLWLWLSAKLVLVPAAILLEDATIRGGIARSWRLTRRRFWPVLGVIVVVWLAFTALGQVVAVPFSLIGGLLGSVLAPTGGDTQGLVVQLVVGLLVQVVVLIIQIVGTIVQSTASCLLYVDCRMRHEGLDLDLLAYVERRDAGEDALPDPFTAGIGRIAAPRYPAMQPPAWGPPPQPAPAWGPPPEAAPAPWDAPPQSAAPVPPAAPPSAPPPPMAPPR